MRFAKSCLVIFLGGVALAAEPAEYRTLDKAVTAVIRPSSGAGLTGYLGASVQFNAEGKLVVEELPTNSPAAKAGVQKGDIITHVGDHPVKTVDAFREWLQSLGPDVTVKLKLIRGGQPMEVTATLTAASRPLKATTVRVYLGIELGESGTGDGIRVERVTPESPAATAGLKDGEVIVKLEGSDVTRPSRLNDLLTEKKPGDVVNFAVVRDGKEVVLKVTLASPDRQANRPGRPRTTSSEVPTIALWKKERFRLAVVGVEFADIKHNDGVPTKEWEDAFFSKGSYSGKMNATGQQVHGSLHDHLRENSAGAMTLEGKVFDWIAVGKKRGDYIQGLGTSNKTAVLSEAIDKVVARDGKDALKDFDGIAFVYAGERVQTNRGTVYYPHSGLIAAQGQRLPYLLGHEGGPRMTAIGGFVKELGRVLGLPDLAARPENQGSEGLGAWCALSNPMSGARPQHYCAWAKEKIGWMTPTVIDPSVKQKLILGVSCDAPKECLKVLVRSDGSEYFLLENRRRKGFDADLPGEGLLVWRVVNDRPVLEESHGIDGPAGPTSHLSSVPFPSSAGNAFTPDTVPSSRSPLGGGLPVYLSEIRRLPDGRIALSVGYEFK